ncbi:melanoma-associated antigen B4 [Cricetulus griseus]|uniref:Melanoma-associated antigen B4 n=1 Tax=Cricetulus griseus TaxID=10029 RepID=G3IF02_CRIGR|nr:melanoma-associated antigen B4 [Cricetulus griseus]XP_027288484.1 melanoma-associated antigen B4 [Cricetulus griseus]EGW06498.1 Melanoma-associated antigen B4 [Cricetulus griseus]ERE65549.1 melanoma-associated antigen B4-like protein [Cricetulus griseus]
MPRGNKSKGRSRAKRHQTHGESKNPQDTQPTAEEEAASPPVGQGDAPSSHDVCTPQGSQEASSHDSPELDVSCSGYDAGAEGSDAGAEGSDAGVEGSVAGAEGSVAGAEERSDADAEAYAAEDEERSARAVKIAAAIQSARRDPLTRKANVLIEFMLEKFKAKKPFTQADMLRVINKKYKVHFTEILRRISVRLELVFGLELKEVDPSSQSYMLVGKLGLSTEGSLSGSSGLPKTGLLMTLLGVIFMKGNRATEEDVWEFLKVVGIYPGKSHVIFGEPGKFITKDLVEENYVTYRQVLGSDPPRYEFRWGPRAYAETTKMKVLEVVAKINNTSPSFFPSMYEEAMLDEANRAAMRFTTVPGNAVEATDVRNIRAHRRCMGHRSSKV